MNVPGMERRERDEFVRDALTERRNLARILEVLSLRAFDNAGERLLIRYCVHRCISGASQLKIASTADSRLCSATTLGNVGTRGRCATVSIRFLPQTMLRANPRAIRPWRVAHSIAFGQMITVLIP